MHAQDSSLNQNLHINKAEVRFIKRKTHVMLGVCLSVCLCATFLQSLRRDIRFLGIGVIDDCELRCGF